MLTIDTNFPKGTIFRTDTGNLKLLILKTLRFYGFGRPPTFSACSRGHRIIPCWANKLRKRLMIRTLHESAFIAKFNL